MSAFLNTSYLFRFFPWVRGLVHVAPFLAPYMTGDIGILMKEMYINTPARIRQARQDHEAGVTRERPSVFTDILASSLPEHEKTVDRLSGEGFSLTGAGTETTAVSPARLTHQPSIIRTDQDLHVEADSTTPSGLCLSSPSMCSRSLPYKRGLLRSLKTRTSQTCRGRRSRSYHI
mgnify:CR=1 FL=1|tara:strand:+ start:42334 stop:42858 length:525 start_codon:yes stop_codon:yes gene_type:complete